MIKKFNIPMGTGPIKKKIDISKADPIYKQLWDMMHDPKDGALFFMTNCCWVKRNGVVQYTPREYQREMLFNYNVDNSIWDKNVTLCGRQMGKTTTSSGYLLWYALCFPSKDILITSYGETSAIEIMETIKFIYDHCPNFLKIPMTSNNKTSVVFSNGSRIFVRPTTIKAGRGLSPAIVYCDEFAFVGTGESAEKTLEKQREFYSSISPTLSASKGKLFITSTPQSQTDMFYTIWSGAIDKTDENMMDLPKYYILKEKGELYVNSHIFKTKQEAEDFVNNSPNKNDYEIVEKDPCGKNGYMSLLADWTKDETKTSIPNFEKKEIEVMGMEKFQREYNCISAKSMINISIEDNKLEIPIETLYKDFCHVRNKKQINK